MIKMKKFTVYKHIAIQECWEIEAEDEFDAKVKADVGDGKLLSKKEIDANFEVYED